MIDIGHLVLTFGIEGREASVWQKVEINIFRTSPGG